MASIETDDSRFGLIGPKRSWFRASAGLSARGGDITDPGRQQRQADDGYEIGGGKSSSPASSIMNVSRLMAENVVKPPQMPAMTNWRLAGPATMRPCGPVKVAKNVITKRADRR